MQKILSVLVVVFLLSCVRPLWADTVEDLKVMMEEMKADYEAKVKELNAKIDVLTEEQKKHSAKIETITTEQTQQVTKLDEIEQKSLDVEYVGRGNAPAGKGGVVVRNPFGFGSVSLGGYADLEYADFENSDAAFLQHRWIINIGAELHDRIAFNSELEIEYGGPNTPNADGEVKVEQAFMDYKIADALNLRAGALLVPFGRYNLYHDSDIQDLTDRPLMAKDVIPTTWTEAGGGIWGQFNPTWGSYEDLKLNYELYAVNGLDSGFSDTGLGSGRPGLKTDNNDDKALVGRLALSPWVNQEVGLSGYWGDYDKIGNAITGSGVDWLTTMGPLEFVGEYAYFGTEESAQGSSDVANFFQGAYAQANYHFWPTFLSRTFLGRGFDDPKLTLVGRYDWALIGDDSDADNQNNEEYRYTLGLNYRPVDSFVFKFEYQWNHTDAEILERGSNNGFLTSVAIGF